MIYNPYLPSPSQADAWSEGIAKGFLGSSSTDPSENVGPDELDAYNEGVLVGLDAAENGFPVDDVCIAAGETEDPFEMPRDTIEYGGIALDVANGAWAGVAAGLFVSAVLLLITAPENTLPPEQVLPGLGQPLVDRVASFGLDSVELFCGVGSDPSATDCELKVTNLFNNLKQARDATIALDRSPSFVVSWRTDQSGSFRIV